MVAAIFFVGCNQEEVVYVGTKDNSYRFNSYNIDIQVDEDRTCVITEEIEVEFLYGSHAGITREIPKITTAKRADGTSQTIIAKVKNFQIIKNGYPENRIYNISESGSYYTVDLGYDNKTNQKFHHYQYRYTYVLGSDNTEDFDEFYFNIVGPYWDCEMHNVTYAVTLPKQFDTSGDNVGSTYGPYGSTNIAVVTIDSSGDKVILSGSMDYLDAFNALTIRAQMPNKYFNVVVINATKIATIIIVLLSIALVVIAVMLWKKYGKDYEITKPVTFYPPQNMSPTDMELHYKSKISSKSTIATVILLANKGYIKITEIKDSNRFQLEKLKDYSESDSKEKSIMEDLFTSNNTVELSDLGGELYYYTITQMRRYNSKKKYESMFEPSSKKYSNMLTILILLCNLLAIIVPAFVLETGDYFIIAFITIFFSCATLVQYANIRDKFARVVSITLYVVYQIGILVGFFKIYFQFESWLWICEIANYVAVVIALIFVAIMPRRNKKETELYGEILAFKDFLVSAEKGRLEALICEDPDYFFNILPYTYVLGVSDKWIKKLDFLAIDNPNWLSTQDRTFIYVMVRVDRSFTGAARSISYRTMRSGSGGSSSGGFSGGGGGFSGGGFGGGGGHSR